MKVNLFLGEDNNAEQLILETLHGDGEVDDGSLGTDFRSVGRIGHLCGDVQLEATVEIDLFLSDFHLEGASRFNEVLLEEAVQDRIKFLANVFDEKRLSVCQSSLQMQAEGFMVETRYLVKMSKDEGENKK